MIENRFFPEIHGNFGFGCMRLPMKNGEVDHELFCQMADTFIDAGFNYFDTAHGYVGGKSEIAIRECVVKRYLREKVCPQHLPIRNLLKDVAKTFE